MKFRIIHGQRKFIKIINFLENRLKNVESYDGDKIDDRYHLLMLFVIREPNSHPLCLFYNCRLIDTKRLSCITRAAEFVDGLYDEIFFYFTEDAFEGLARLRGQRKFP